MIKSILVIFIGGGVGSVLRYIISVLFSRFGSVGSFPWATLIVNIVGCVLIGIFHTLSAKWSVDNEVRLFLTVGLCGGFTTFSTFGAESLSLFQNGMYAPFALYVAMSLILGIGGVMLGAWFCKFC